jgi:putative hydrolase of the HAD superfamily
MIKAVIFDCFGVLTVSTWDILCDEFFSGQPEKKTKASQVMDDFNGRRISELEFDEKIAELTGLSPSAVKEYLAAKSDANLPLFAYIKQKLKPKYKIGFLSNAGGNWLSELFEPEQIDLFDEIVLSFETGLIKPDPKIFELICQKMGIKINEAIFIDDIERYTAAAAAMGMGAVTYRGFEQMKSELEALLKTS